MPALAGRRAILLDGRSRVSLVRAPDVDGAAVSRPLAGRTGDTVSLLPMGPGVEGVTTRGLALPAGRRAAAAGRGPRPVECPNVADAEVVLRRGLLLVVESPATL